MELPREAEIATARRLTVLVGLVFVAVQLIAFSSDRQPSWDEAIYLSQVWPDAEPLPFVASRARGITVLAMPVILLGGSLSTLRVFLAIASAAALIGAFRLWAPVIGLGAVGAAVLFAGAWPTLFYGSELMPNLWLALIRPLDATVLAATLVLVPVVLRRATWSWVGFLLLGLAAGWAPWLIEMTARFGSLGEAFAAAARLGHTGRWSFIENVRQYLALSDGPSVGPVANPDVPVVGILGVVGITVLVVVGIREAVRHGFVSSVMVALAAGAALAAEYVVFTDAQAPRFLLPAFALFAVPAGFGLSSIVVGPRERTGADVAWTALASVLVAGWLFQQVAIASRIEDGVTVHRASAADVGRQIRSLVAQEPCFVDSESNFPMVGYAAGCRAAEMGDRLRTWAQRADRLAREGRRPFLVLRRSEEPRPPDEAVLVRTIPSADDVAWYVFERA